MNNLLSMVANPAPNNFAANMLAGRQAGLTAQATQSQTQGQDIQNQAALMKNFFTDSLSAMLMPDLDSQNTFIDSLMSRYQQSPEISEILGIAKQLPPDKRMEYFQKIADQGVKAGILPGESKEKTSQVLGPGQGLYDIDPSTGEYVQRAVNPAKPAPVVEIKQGTIPSGYRETKAGDLEPIPGSPAAIAQQEKIDSLITSYKTVENNVSMVKGLIDRAINETDWTTTGLWGKAASFVPGSDSFALRKKVDTIKANLTLDKLRELKGQSKTGASGLGSTSEREFSALGDSIANLDQAQSPAELKLALKAVDFHYNNILELEKEATRRTAKRYGLKNIDEFLGTEQGQEVTNINPATGQQETWKVYPDGTGERIR